MAGVHFARAGTVPVQQWPPQTCKNGIAGLSRPDL